MIPRAQLTAAERGWKNAAVDPPPAHVLLRFKHEMLQVQWTQELNLENAQDAISPYLWYKLTGISKELAAAGVRDE